MKHLKTYGKFTDVHYKLFESSNDGIRPDIIDILSPITDDGITTLSIDRYYKGELRSSVQSEVIELRLTNKSHMVKPVDNKEDFERLKDYLRSKGYRFERWWITHGQDRSWNNLFKVERDDEWDDMRYPVKEEWIELYFIK